MPSLLASRVFSMVGFRGGGGREGCEQCSRTGPPGAKVSRVLPIPARLLNLFVYLSI